MARDKSERSVQRILRRDVLVTIAPIALAVAAAFALAVQFIKPAPPRKLTLAYAPDEGGAAWYAKKYQEFLAREGITLELHQTKGSLTNLDLVSFPSDASIAFVQSGTPAAEGAESRVVSLGSLSYIPLWIFYRGAAIDDVRALKGRRLGAGAPLSGTRALAKALLSAAGAGGPETALLPLGREDGLAELQKGEIDALFLVAPAESPAIKKIAAEPGLRMLSFARADAYVRRFPYLSKLTLPHGVFDLAADVPSADVALLAPTLNLLARDSLHPALAYLLMRAATEIHGGAGVLDNEGEFPAPRTAGFPLSAQAKRYYQTGAPFLQRYLPFWAANLVDRLWVMLVPLLAVLLPLGRAVPALYRWRLQRKLFQWYGRLKELEIHLDESPERVRLEEMLGRLEEIDRAVNMIRTPLAFAENLYFFREHVEVVRRRIVRQLADRAAPAATQA